MEATEADRDEAEFVLRMSAASHIRQALQLRGLGHGDVAECYERRAAGLRAVAAEINREVK